MTALPGFNCEQEIHRHRCTAVVRVLRLRANCQAVIQ